MGRYKNTFRNIALLVIFVMLVICSILSFSYAYYSSTATSNPTFAVHNTSVECLSIETSTSNYYMETSLPSYFYPVSDTYARTTQGDANEHGGGTWDDNNYTGKAFGMESIHVGNKCASAVNFDVLFIPNTYNQINMNYVRFALCSGDWWAGSGTNCWNPVSSTYTAAKTLGNSSTCYSSSSSGFWSYMASTSIGGNALGGSDARMCSFLRQNYSSGISIAANSSTKITIRYWLNETTPLAQYNNKRLAGKFVVYGY